MPVSTGPHARPKLLSEPRRKPRPAGPARRVAPLADGEAPAPPLESRQLSRFEGAYRHLRQLIMSGTYSPNQRLVEADLTRSLAVSRATVRVVLMRLKDEGLVDIAAKRGARVRAVAPDEALKILKVREVLEGLAASLAATHATDAQLRDLSAIIDDMAAAIEEDDLLRYTSSNGRFHEQLVLAADHDALRRALDALHFSLIRYRFRLVLVPGRKRESLTEHRRILECLLRRDAAGAERAMRHHMSRVSAVLGESKDLPPI